ncbi:MAG TPA: endonuclease/exonuclease/phosphatase family protein [bacterium]|nr:endonuclease/exonuclease/phosphatase family protein [bacterium]
MAPEKIGEGFIMPLTARRVLAVASVLAGLILAPCLKGAAPRSGSFTILTYNVAGLPEGISQSHPLWYSKMISPRLSAFDIVVVQEDFVYGRDLRSQDDHPYYSGRSRSGIFGDGLARFSRFPMGAVEHAAWEACHGHLDSGSDCLTPKGFSVAAHELAPGVFLEVYNLHFDAGGAEGDLAARAAEMDQLITALAARSAGRAVILAGDWNLSPKRAENLELLDKILTSQGLTDSCRALNCGRERIDRVMFRSGAGLSLRPVAYKVETERFADRKGRPLSDHDAVSVGFEWEFAGETED